MLRISGLLSLKLVMAAFVFVLLTPGLAWGGELPIVNPGDVGMSTAKIAEIDTIMEKMVEERKTPGVVVVVARHGKIVHFGAYGLRETRHKKPMQNDSIFRIFSMTKAITSAAALMLYDDGKLDIEAPISNYLPEFKGLKLYREGAEPATPGREMTAKDLMLHTAGLSDGYSFKPIDAMYKQSKIIVPGTGVNYDLSLAALTARLGKLPLRFEPGTDWVYGISTDVLARVIEVISEKPFDQFLEERIFKPLDMKDTGFYVPQDKIGRFTAYFRPNFEVIENPESSLWLTKPVQLSGSSGLVSTARDYIRFLVMLTNQGMFQGKRLLSKESIMLMTTNQMPKNLPWIRADAGRAESFGLGFGFGNMISVKVGKSNPQDKIGECGWSGAASTHYWFSPEDGLAVATFEQIYPFKDHTMKALKTVIYDSLEN